MLRPYMRARSEPLPSAPSPSQSQQASNIPQNWQSELFTNRSIQYTRFPIGNGGSSATLNAQEVPRSEGSKSRENRGFYSTGQRSPSSNRSLGTVVNWKSPRVENCLVNEPSAEEKLESCLQSLYVQPDNCGAPSWNSCDFPPIPVSVNRSSNPMSMGNLVEYPEKQTPAPKNLHPPRNQTCGDADVAIASSAKRGEHSLSNVLEPPDQTNTTFVNDTWTEEIEWDLTPRSIQGSCDDLLLNDGTFAGLMGTEPAIWDENLFDNSNYTFSSPSLESLDAGSRISHEYSNFMSSSKTIELPSAVYNFTDHLPTCMPSQPDSTANLVSPTEVPHNLRSPPCLSIIKGNSPTPRKIYTCPIYHCHRRDVVRGFQRKDHLLQHLRVAHLKDQKDLVPAFCPHKECSLSRGFRCSDRAFLTARKYSEHLKKSHGESLFNCSVQGCRRKGQYGYSGLANLLRHAAKKHPLMVNQIMDSQSCPIEQLANAW